MNKYVELDLEQLQQISGGMRGVFGVEISLGIQIAFFRD